MTKSIFRITDTVTGRTTAKIISPEDCNAPLQYLLDTYVKQPTTDPQQQEVLGGYPLDDMSVSISDLLYNCSHQGVFTDLFPGIEFIQHSQAKSLNYPLKAARITIEATDYNLLDLNVDRNGCGYDRNWVGFTKRRWNIQPELYTSFIYETVRKAYGNSRAEHICAVETPSSMLLVLRALAKRIWESDFENYSRFIGKKLRYKWGDETVLSIINGAGGICSEKVQALKFLTDHLGLESEYILAGPNIPEPVPETKLRELLSTFDWRFAKRHMRYWQHVALKYNIRGKPVVVDATNGNIPFLFLEGSEADRLLGYKNKPAIPVKMTINHEDFFYHRVSQDIVLDLFFAMEGWIPDMDLVQVFDNELGLYISTDYMVTAIAFAEYSTLTKTVSEYESACKKVGLECEISNSWSFESSLGTSFKNAHPAVSEHILATRDHLLGRYDECHKATHEGNLVVISLK